MREKMDVAESDQTIWVCSLTLTVRQDDTDFGSQRIDAIGFDRDLRSYFVLDDNRLYRRTEPPLPPPPKPKPKANSLKARAARRRASKRRRVEDSSTPEVKEEDGKVLPGGVDGNSVDGPVQDTDTFGGFKWELIAITLSQYQDFIASLKMRDPDEKDLRQVL